MKSNYGPIAESVTLRWRNGVFIPEPKAGSLGKIAADTKADDVFLQLLDRFNRQGRLPYASAASGANAREEITKILRRFGCESVGFMDDFDKHEVLLAFTHRGRQIQLPASAKGWAAMYLKAEPWTHRRRGLRIDYEQAALRQGHVAVNSILRDWIKGQMTAIECGILVSMRCSCRTC